MQHREHYSYLIEFGGFAVTAQGQRWGNRIFSLLTCIKNGVVIHL